jgi:hypothetical protein
MTTDKQDVETATKPEHIGTPKVKKTPLYKRPWFWVMLVIVFVLIPAGIGGAANNSNTTVQTSGTSSASASQNTTTPPKPQPSSAHVGSTISLKDQDGNPIDVTLVKVVDPATASDSLQPDTGKRFVGVQIKITNTGTNAISDDPDTDVTAFDSASQSYNSSLYPLDDCPKITSELKLTPGSSVLGCESFQLPIGTPLAKFQFTPSSGFSSSTGEWLIP